MASRFTSGRVVHYNYDGSTLDGDISRLSAVNDSTGSSTDVLESFTYLGLGTVVERNRGNGIDLTHLGSPGDGGDQYAGFDRFGRIATMHWTDGTTSADSFAYGHDRNGNRLYEANLLTAGHDELYHDGAGYDGLNRLTSFARGDLSGTNDAITGTAARTQEWNLDVLGNMPSVTTDGVAETRTHDSQNRLTEVGSNSLTHSANGEMTTDEDGNTLTYDGWGRVVGWSDGTTTIAYETDALNRRITRGDGATTRHDYHSAQWQVIEEREDGTASGDTATHYVWSPVYVDAMILRDVDQNADGDTTDVGDERLYVQHDANFNVTAIADAAGSVVERYLYDAYGLRTVLDADWTDDLDGATDYSWYHSHQGGRLDPLTGLHHFRHRDYDATLMRWTRQDPLGFVDGANLYLSLISNPLTLTDPLGLCVDTDCERFVDGILDLIDEWQTHKREQFNEGNSELAQRLAAYGMPDHHPNLRKFRDAMRGTFGPDNAAHPDGITGFRQSLVPPAQGMDVYAHLIGSMHLALTDDEATWRLQNQVDRQQLDAERNKQKPDPDKIAEHKAELEGNLLGYAAGHDVLSFLDGELTYDQLRSRLIGQFCEPTK